MRQLIEPYIAGAESRVNRSAKKRDFFSERGDIQSLLYCEGLSGKNISELDALAGYETVNWGDRLLYDGSTLLAKDAFIYDGAITLELESYITDRIVLLANVRERVLWGGSLGKFSTQFGLGIKFIIN